MQKGDNGTDKGQNFLLFVFQNDGKGKMLSYFSLEKA